MLQVETGTPSLVLIRKLYSQPVLSSEQYLMRFSIVHPLPAVDTAEAAVAVASAVVDVVVVAGIACDPVARQAVGVVRDPAAFVGTYPRHLEYSARHAA